MLMVLCARLHYKVDIVNCFNLDRFQWGMVSGKNE